MNVIISYFGDMLPYMIIAVPIYFVVRFLMLRKKNNKVNWYREGLLLIFVMFCVGLGSLTIIPRYEFGVRGFEVLKVRVHKTNLIPFKVLFETYIEVFKNDNINYFLINFLGNIIMFIPFGVVIPILWKLSNKQVVLIGFCISFLIEFCQLFLTRGTDVDDLFLNTLGVYFGICIFKLISKKFNKILIKFR